MEVITSETMCCQACGCSEWTVRDGTTWTCSNCDSSMLLALLRVRDALRAENEKLRKALSRAAGAVQGRGCPCCEAASETLEAALRDAAGRGE